MKKSTMINWFIASLLLVVAGIVCLCLPVDTTLSTFAYIIGAIVLIVGIIEVVVYFTVGMYIGSGFLLVNGIITMILGVLLLSNKDVTVAVLPYIFGMWFIIEGITELSLSLTGLKLRLSYSWVITVLSCLEIIFGVVAMFYPVASSISLVVLVGIFLLIEGVSMFGDWAIVLRTKKFFKNLSKSIEE
jgi:membrane protein HdeD